MSMSSIKDQTAILGGVTWLCQHSPLHQRYPVGMFLDRIVASIEINQFRYFENDHGTPIAFCNWAHLSKDLLDQALEGDLAFQRQDWKSGSYFFIPEMIAPFGHCRQVVRDLRQNIVPKDQKVWAIRGQIQTQNGSKAPRIQRFKNV